MRLAAARRALAGACAAHALHDGYTDLIYLLLPIWHAEFGLDYAALAMLRGLYSGVMAVLQVPIGHVAGRHLGSRSILVIGTVLAAVGYAVAGFSAGLLTLCVGLAISGTGSGTQHPLASASVSRAYGAGARGPLGTYNFAGDIGKAAVPGLTSLLLTVMPWRHALWAVAGLGVLVAGLVRILLTAAEGTQTAGKIVRGEGRGGFPLLFSIGVLDSSVRMGFLTFLPFLMKGKGAEIPTVGLSLALVFLGGAAGKFACGWLGARIGLLLTVLVTEAGTAAAIVGVLILPLGPAMLLLPVLGVMLNGTSSVLYGTVPELARAERVERAFAIFYTGTIGAGALAPILYGALGDVTGPVGATLAAAATALITLPLAVVLAPKLLSPDTPPAPAHHAAAHEQAR